MLRSPRVYKAALNMLHLTGLDAVCAPVTRGAGVIFMLHHVRPENPAQFAPNRILSITPGFLKTVIRQVLEIGFEVVSLDEACARMSGPDGEAQTVSRPFACFTFDDGYRDNLEYAYPIFKKTGIPFTIYVPADFADGRGELWWLTLEDIVRGVETLSLDIDGRRRTFNCAREEERANTFDTLYWWLRKSPDAEIRCVVNQLAREAGLDPLARGRDLLMDWDELRTLARDPLVTIGAHTLSHVALAKLPDAEARREMADSIARVETELGRPCVHFSYPYGDPGSVSERDVRIAAKLGLKSAVTTSKGVVSQHGANNLHALSRFSLNGDYQQERYLKVLLSGLPFAVWNTAAKLVARRRLSWPPTSQRPV